MRTFLNDKVTLHAGDCLDVIKTIPDSSIDSVVTDPPYALVSIVKRFGSENAAAAKGDVYARASAGFMGKQWDTGEVAFSEGFWREVLRVLKPGGHVVAASGTRTYHRLTCAIEDAGFEIRDQFLYLYGTGFPKSHNVSRNIGDGRCSCQALSERDVRPVRDGDVSAPLDASDERGKVLLARVSEQGASSAILQRAAAAARASEPGVEGRRDVSKEAGELRQRPLCEVSGQVSGDGTNGRLRDGTPAGDGVMGRARTDADGMRASLGPQPAEQHAGEPGTVAGQPQSQNGGAWPHCERCGKPIIPDGLGTALKPACEPWVLARKPLIGTVAANVLAHGTGALNVDGCRVGTTRGVPASHSKAASDVGATGISGKRLASELDPNMGRWPANVIHDGSAEVVGAFPDALGMSTQRDLKTTESNYFGADKHPGVRVGRGDSGSAARFFYSAKADADDRLGSKHPTVKPVDLMQYLCRLVTPPGGTVLDPFAGTGTTGEAAWREGFRAVLIEREAEYQADIARRMALALGGPDERKVAIIKEKTKGKPIDHGPLFGWEAAE